MSSPQHDNKQLESIERERIKVENDRRRWALILTAVIGFLATGVTVADYVTRLEAGATLTSVYINGALTIIAIIGFLICWFGYVQQGMLFFIVAFGITLASMITQVDDIGLIVGAVILAVAIGCALRTLPSHLIQPAGFFGVSMMIIVLLADRLWLPDRPPSPAPLEIVGGVVVIGAFVSSLIIIRRNFTGYSLSTKLISSTIIVAVLAVGVVTVILSRNTQNILEQEASDNLTSVSKAQALLIGEFLARELNKVQILALNELFLTSAIGRNTVYIGDDETTLQGLLATDDRWVDAADDDPLIVGIIDNTLAKQLRDFRQEFPQHVEVFFTDVEGGLIASTNRTSDYYQADEEWWQDAFSNGLGGVHIGNPEFDESSGVPTSINIAVPLFSRSDQGVKIVGVMRSTLTLSSLNDLLNASLFSETGQVDILFANNELARVTEDGRFLLTPIPATSQEVVDSLGLSGEVVIDDYYDIRRLITRQQINTLSHEPFIDALAWNVVVYESEAEALGPLDRQLDINLVLGIVVILAAAGGAALVSRLIVSPIERLTDVALQVAGGDLEVRSPIEGDDEVGTLASTFNQMTGQLQNLVGSLEQRVAARTRIIATSVDVGRRLSLILDEQQLVREVVEQVQSNFDYYHAHIYLVDKHDQNLLRMAGGTGEAGQTLLARNHSIVRGQGLVGNAAATNGVVLVPDVSQAEGWLPNPLLPETKAEVAVPIAVGDDVVGVLDVQHDVKDGLRQEDADLLLSIATQVAIALQNAQQYTAAQVQAKNAAQLNEIVQQIQSTTSIDEALKVAVRELGRATNAKQASVQLRSQVEANGQSGSEGKA